MATYYFYGSAALDKRWNSNSTSYQTARNGGTINSVSNATLHPVGQQFLTSTYYCYEGYFAVSGMWADVLGGQLITGATFSLSIANTYAPFTYSVNGYWNTPDQWFTPADASSGTWPQDWSLTITSGSLGRQYMSIPTARIPIYNLVAVVYMTATNRMIVGSAPTSGNPEYVNFYSADQGGTATVDDPWIIVNTYDPPPPSVVTVTGSLPSDAITRQTVTGSLPSDAIKRRTFPGSLSVNSMIAWWFRSSSTLKKTMTGATLTNAIAKTTFTRSFASQALRKVTFSGTFTGNAWSAYWVSPPNNAAFPSYTPLVWRSRSAATPAHFVLEFDTAPTFASSDRITLTSINDSGFQYFNGTDWVGIPSTGVPAGSLGNNIRYTQWSRSGGWYRRVRQA